MRDKARTKAQLIDELVELRRRISALAKPEAESKEKRKRRMLAEKRAITEQLAGSIGHELHNILGNISNAAYFLNLAIKDPAPEVKEALKVLKRGGGSLRVHHQKSAGLCASKSLQTAEGGYPQRPSGSAGRHFSAAER